MNTLLMRLSKAGYGSQIKRRKIARKIRGKITFRAIVNVRILVVVVVLVA